MPRFFVPIGPVSTNLVRKPHLGGIPWMHVHVWRRGRKELLEGLRFESREAAEAVGYPLGWGVA